MKKLSLLGFYRYWVHLTYCSVISATVGICFAICGNTYAAILCLMISGVCDMFDGAVARKAQRNEMEKGYGIQIDSLADVIGFGVFPAIIGYALHAQTAPESKPAMILTALSMAVYILAALIRLAYYNVTEEELQSEGVKRTYYEGLPVTSAALIIPMAYALARFSSHVSLIYNIVLLLMAAAFVLKFRIPKLRISKIVIIGTVCVVITVAALLIKGAN